MKTEALEGDGGKIETAEYLVSGNNEEAVAVWKEFCDKTEAGEPARVKIVQEFVEGTVDKEINDYYPSNFIEAREIDFEQVFLIMVEI